MTQIDANGTYAAANHSALLPLVLVQNSAVGLYLAPEFGSGAGYKSTMIGGGVSVKLISAGRVDVRGLAGHTTYQFAPSSAGSGIGATSWSSQGVRRVR